MLQKMYLFQLPIFLEQPVLVLFRVKSSPYVPFPFKVQEQLLGNELIWCYLFSSEASTSLAGTLQAQIRIDEFFEFKEIKVSEAYTDFSLSVCKYIPCVVFLLKYNSFNIASQCKKPCGSTT